MLTDSDGERGSQPATDDSAAHRALALLAQHRLATTPHLQQLVAPNATR
ncbi:hypothetical protein ACFV3E_42345 [Streptomyces sp. NPDC059718]